MFPARWPIGGRAMTIQPPRLRGFTFQSLPNQIAGAFDPSVNFEAVKDADLAKRGDKLTGLSVPLRGDFDSVIAPRFKIRIAPSIDKDEMP